MPPSAPTRPIDAAFEATWREGRRAWPRLELPFEDYLPDAPDAPLPRASGDFYLARACNAGVPGAWERLQVRFRRPLRAFLRRRGAKAQEADGLLDELWGALATPPPRGAAPTRIGTYDGRGALHSWMATILWRRLADRWRARNGTAELREEEPAPRGPRQDPSLTVTHAETTRLLGASLEEAWSSLTDRELQVVVLKYCRKLPQTEIARILRVSPPRVTRMLQSATSRLRSAITARFDRHTDWEVGGGGWDGLLATVERMLARTDATVAVPGEGKAADG